ncbi:MAG: hypothetical protein JJT94_09670 [Bernardetiaceae bacterium]|nr:hypothetical protein [Bernardetiaceae bacterium]
MRLFRRFSFVFVVLLSTLFFVKCSCDEDDEPEPVAQVSIVETISKTWRIQTLEVGGTPFTDGIEDFRLTLQRDGDNPTTYSLATGGLQYNFAPTPSGSWSINQTLNQITFAGTPVNYLNATANNLDLQYTVPEDQDKNTPTVIFRLVPVE